MAYSAVMADAVASIGPMLLLFARVESSRTRRKEASASRDATATSSCGTSMFDDAVATSSHILHSVSIAARRSAVHSTRAALRYAVAVDGCVCALPLILPRV